MNIDTVKPISIVTTAIIEKDSFELTTSIANFEGLGNINVKTIKEHISHMFLNIRSKTEMQGKYIFTAYRSERGIYSCQVRINGFKSLTIEAHDVHDKTKKNLLNISGTLAPNEMDIVIELVNVIYFLENTKLVRYLK